MPVDGTPRDLGDNLRLRWFQMADIEGLAALTSSVFPTLPALIALVSLTVPIARLAGCGDERRGRSGYGRNVVEVPTVDAIGDRDPGEVRDGVTAGAVLRQPNGYARALLVGSVGRWMPVPGDAGVIRKLALETGERQLELRSRAEVGVGRGHAGGAVPFLERPV